ncbi:DUF6881 domain-containing protein [Bradyrhizobium sp. HKCCYLS2058]|uniref:DUF6881 domain-containing protein n=1 Tax=unclassified Bradyrhizobium TaxID=2631580 RepID=UPI003EC140D6
MSTPCTCLCPPYASLSPPGFAKRWSELDGERFETRKLEIFRDGSIGFATATEATDRTRLGKIAVPPIDEIGQDPQFVAEEISKEKFERRWSARRAR